MESRPAKLSVDSLLSGLVVTFPDSLFFSHNPPDAAFPSANKVLTKSTNQDQYSEDRVDHIPVFFLLDRWV